MNLAANIQSLQEHLPVRASETLLSQRSPKNLLTLVICQIAALFCLASPGSALTIVSVVPSKRKVTVNWSGGTAPFQLEKSTDLKTWEPVDTETSSSSLTSIQTSPNGFYRVGNGGSGGGASGGNIIDTTAPSVQTGVKATNNSCSQITVSWTASTDSGRNATGVKGYYVYRDGIFLRSVLAPATLTSDVGLSPSTSYTYTVRAYDGATNLSGYSTAVTTTTPVCADITPPSVPSGVTAISSSCSQINITWSPSTDNAGGSGLQGYSVYRNNAFWKQVLAPATSTSDTGLAVGTTVNYAVMAIDNAGNQSALCAASTATTPSRGDTTTPSIPTGLIVTAASCSQINLSWAASTDNAGGTGVGSYYIYRDGFYLKPVVGGTSTSDAGLAPSTSHSYAVTAVDNAGNRSAKCAALSATTPACPDTVAPSVPAGLTATAASTDQINLSWNPSLDNAGNLSSLSVQACATTQTPACTYSLSSSSASALASGTTTVTPASGCTWTRTSNAAWLTCAPDSGNGTDSLTWTAAANTGTITVQGQTFTGVSCTYILSSTHKTFTATTAGVVGDTTPPAVNLTSAGVCLGACKLGRVSVSDSFIAKYSSDWEYICSKRFVAARPNWGGTNGNNLWSKRLSGMIENQPSAPAMDKQATLLSSDSTQPSVPPILRASCLGYAVPPFPFLAYIAMLLGCGSELLSNAKGRTLRELALWLREKWRQNRRFGSRLIDQWFANLCDEFPDDRSNLELPPQAANLNPMKFLYGLCREFENKLLIVLAQNGDEQALGILYTFHREPLVGYASSKLTSFHTAQDVASQVWLTIQEKGLWRFDTRHPQANFARWLRTKCDWLILDYYGQRQLEQLPEDANLQKLQADTEDLASLDEVDGLFLLLFKLRPVDTILFGIAKLLGVRNNKMVEKYFRLEIRRVLQEAENLLADQMETRAQIVHELFDSVRARIDDKLASTTLYQYFGIAESDPRAKHIASAKTSQTLAHVKRMMLLWWLRGRCSKRI